MIVTLLRALLRRGQLRVPLPSLVFSGINLVRQGLRERRHRQELLHLLRLRRVLQDLLHQLLHELGGEQAVRSLLLLQELHQQPRNVS